ncbi:hypothetical protein CK203_038843 [Vitis vinifera]|uniref:Uncharacterized protein n=1 Tax=Vitis vinifera TaxID=29760 RepID=A0A438I1P5_VITVI|nr:hypothetical protein CK203_038843 [Vitis vinifera]
MDSMSRELVTTLVNLGRTPERIFVAEEALLNHYISSISPGVSVYEIVKPHHEEWTFILVLELHGQKSEEGAFALFAGLLVRLVMIAKRSLSKPEAKDSVGMRNAEGDRKGFGNRLELMLHVLYFSENC